MLNQLGGVVYFVADLERAKQWYKEVLGTQFCLEQNQNVVFYVKDVSVVLSLRTGPQPVEEPGSLAIWKVNDVNAAYQRLLQLGAQSCSEVEERLSGFFEASVRDPFGNTIVLAGPKIQTVTVEPSKTAVGVAFARAVTAIEKAEWVTSADDFAKLFIPDDYIAILQDPSLRSWVKENRFPPGMHEYIAVRTIWFDRIFEQALKRNDSQIVVLGAGYDTRAIRFREFINDVRIFELDIHTTQQHKKECLARHSVSIPEQLTFVSVDLNSASITDALLSAGYDRTLNTLFIWEGVSYYLSSETIDAILELIRSNAKVGSTIAFDYALLSPRTINAYGVQELSEYMRSENQGEPIRFFLAEEEKTADFLKERGFEIIDHQTSEQLEKEFLSRPDGSFECRIVGCFAFVHAMVERSICK